MFITIEWRLPAYHYLHYLSRNMKSNVNINITFPYSAERKKRKNTVFLDIGFNLAFFIVNLGTLTHKLCVIDRLNI